MGIGYEVLRYVQQLEWRIKELEARLLNAESLPAEQLAERNKIAIAQQRKIKQLTQQLKLTEAANHITQLIKVTFI